MICRGFSNSDKQLCTRRWFFEITFIGSKVEETVDRTVTDGHVDQQLIYESEELLDGQHTIKVMLPEDTGEAT